MEKQRGRQHKMIKMRTKNIKKSENWGAWLDVHGWENTREKKMKREWNSW